MLKKIFTLFSGLKMTIIGGLFLLIDLIPHLAKEFWAKDIHLPLPFDPAFITVIICGYPLLYLAVWRIIHNKGISKISSALLITIAMFAAIYIGDLFAAGEVCFIMSLGALLEDATTNRAKKGLKKLIDLAPQKARIVKGEREEIIDADEVKVGDVIRILPGETIAVDGCIIRGETSIDQAVMTGESLPVDKTIGDEVYSGTINRFGSIDIKASKVGEEGSLKRLIKMVEDADKKQAPMQRIADRAASYLVPVALTIAILSYIITKDIVKAVTILVVFCPCALVLATPTAIMAAIGQATKHGVIIKSGEALEKMGKVDTIAFDKTGTLTYGKLEVSNVISFSSLKEYELISLAASAEKRSEHPLGKAICQKAEEEKLAVKSPESFKMEAGKGVSATLDGKTIAAGNEKYFREHDITLSEDIVRTLDKLRKEGKASILIALDNNAIGIIALSDVIRKEAKDVIEKLRKVNTDAVLLTGDNELTASYFASKVNLSKVKSNLLPEDKVKEIERLKESGKKVCMIGDGINDAPALKTADVSVAMAKSGSDIAIDASDIALIGDDISKIPYLKRLSNATVKTIKASITLSMTINFFAIVLSLLGLLNPTTGALVHNAGSCFVVLIAALLYDRKFD